MSEPITQETLHEAVVQLTRAVKALEITLANDYPTRREVRLRRKQVTIATVAAIVLSYFGTVSTISYCFLDGVPALDEKQFCNIFPGYRDSFNNNLRFLENYKKLEDYVKQNDSRIEELERNR